MEWRVYAQSTCFIYWVLNLQSNGTRANVSIKSKLTFYKLVRPIFGLQASKAKRSKIEQTNKYTIEWVVG